MITASERLLRGGAAELPGARTLVVIGGVGGALVGVALGSSSGEPLLALYAAIKVPLLLAFTTALCLPSFYVLNAVLGLSADFGAALRGMLAAQAMLGLALGALAPLFAFHPLALANPYMVTLTDALLFAFATFAAQQVLARHYAPLIARNPRHRTARNAWLVLYAFAGIQAAWVLRPFRGTSGFAVEFVRAEAFEQNAYLVLFEHFVRMWR